jgi:hypothetical protein
VKQEVACAGGWYCSDGPMHMQHLNPSPTEGISDFLRFNRRMNYNDSESVEGFYFAVPFPCLQDVVP